jgi:SAM-dependent methyltransferase
MTRPESIENRWDILYAEYPEVYEAFASFPYDRQVAASVPEIIDLQGKVVVDAGSGTGKSSLMLAHHALRVFGVERELAMLRVAVAQPTDQTMAPLSYVCGDALALPLADGSVDVVTGFTLALWPFDLYRTFIREGRRVARGMVVYLGIPPGWYGGELFEIIEDPDKLDNTVDDIFLKEFGFQYRDLDSVQEYGTLENITGTYGFIFGKQTIKYLREHNQTSIHWRYRLYWSE